MLCVICLRQCPAAWSLCQPQAASPPQAALEVPRYLNELEAQAPNPALEACLQFSGRMELLSEEVPLPTGALGHILAKLLNARLGIQIPPESRDFDACEWVSELEEAASFELLTKLQPILLEYWRSFAKKHPHAEWIQEFKDRMKAACAAAASEVSAGGAPAFVETPTTGGATPVPLAATVDVNDVTAGVTTNSEAATGAAEGATPAPAINVGDLVIGKASKYKEKFNDVECRVTSILAKHYWVTILTGPEKGNEHKYLHHCVSLKPPPAILFQAAKGAAPQAVPVADNAETVPDNADTGTAEPEAAAADAPAATAAPAATSALPILSVAELWKYYGLMRSLARLDRPRRTVLFY